MVNSKNTIIFQGSRGGPTFSRGGGGRSNFFGGGGGGGGGGSNCLFPIETHITCDFPGGVRTPCPPSGSALELYKEKNGKFYNFSKEKIRYGSRWIN